MTKLTPSRTKLQRLWRWRTPRVTPTALTLQVSFVPPVMKVKQMRFQSNLPPRLLVLAGWNRRMLASGSTVSPGRFITSKEAMAHHLMGLLFVHVADVLVQIIYQLEALSWSSSASSAKRERAVMVPSVYKKSHSPFAI